MWKENLVPRLEIKLSSLSNLNRLNFSSFSTPPGLGTVSFSRGNFGTLMQCRVEQDCCIHTKHEFKANNLHQPLLEPFSRLKSPLWVLTSLFSCLNRHIRCLKLHKMAFGWAQDWPKSQLVWLAGFMAAAAPNPAWDGFQ